MNRAYFRKARATMRRHGVFMQGVTPCSPLDEPYVYTAGFDLLDPPAPEVIMFGQPVPTAGRLIQAVFDRVRSGRATLRPGDVLTDFPDVGPDIALRVDEVLPQWVIAYARWAFDLLDTSEIPRYVQLVWADRLGRWPEGTRGDGCALHHQPLLACDPAWRVPVEHTAAEDMFLGHALGDDRVALHVLEGDEPEGRFEVLACTRLDDRRVRIGQVPWLADYVAYGDDVGVRAKLPGEHDAGLDEVLMGGAVLSRAGYQALAYDLVGRAGRTGIRLGEVLEQLTADPGEARASTSSGSLHINTMRPEAARAALRPFVRDGFLAEADLRSSANSLPPSIDGSCCTSAGSSGRCPVCGREQDRAKR
jgi:hypothetical protein